MKALKTGAVVLLGMVLAAPVWGHPLTLSNIESDVACETIGSSTKFPVVKSVVVNEDRSMTIRVETNPLALSHGFLQMGVFYEEHPLMESFESLISAGWSGHMGYAGIRSYRTIPFDPGRYLVRAYRPIRPIDNVYSSSIGCHVHAVVTGAPPPEPEPPSPPEPEPPEPPPEPEPPEPPPEPEPPEPEEPDPEEPDHTHPVERCDHIAIVPAMPRALSGDEGSPDHWLRISNPGAASITFTVTGLDEGGTKAGTYRRELPASRIVRVKMRDVEAAFDVEPEGWWRLVVTGSGPVEVVATMRQGAERRFVPVRTPATCTSGPVTRTGA